MTTDHLPLLELRHLAALRALAQTGSFHAAADQLDYTQSAISQHIAALEAIVGVRLIERSRGRRTIAMTEAGELLLRHADSIVARIQAAEADMAAYVAGTSGLLRVGTYQSVGARVLPLVVGRFSEAWPDVHIRLTEAPNDEALLGLVERGELDLAFAIDPLPAGPFEGVELFHDPYVLIVPTTSALARRRRAPMLAEIAAMPLIGFRLCRSVELVENRLRRTGVDPEFVFRSDDNGTVRGLVAAGVGVAVMPRLTVDESDPAIVALPTDLPPRVIQIVWHRDRFRSPASRAFVDVAREVCAELEPAPRLATA